MDPLFATAPDPLRAPSVVGDFHLNATNSPAIDAGEDAFILSDVDLDGEARFRGAAVDLPAGSHHRLR